jgi:hypothetical protein
MNAVDGVRMADFNAKLAPQRTFYYTLIFLVLRIKQK